MGWPSRKSSLSRSDNNESKKSVINAKFGPTRAWVIDHIGAPPVLRHMEPNAPGRGQARIAVAACGLNFADLLMQDGSYQERAKD